VRLVGILRDTNERRAEPHGGRTTLPTSRYETYGEYYRGRAPSEFGKRFHRYWHARLLKAVSRFLPALSANGSVFEVGAGHGFFAEACRDLRLRYSGCEMNEAQAVNLRERGFAVGTATVPPVPAGPQVDCVWMSHVLEHMRDHVEARDAVSSAADRLRPGGCLVVISPDIASWKWNFWDVDWSHGYPTSLRRVRELLEDAGLEIIAARYHTATIETSFSAIVLSWLFRLIPYRSLDWVLRRAGSREFGHSFMGMYGWRQILLIGKLSAQAARSRLAEQGKSGAIQ
jgi:SAM-dependent methyltransferase